MYMDLYLFRNHSLQAVSCNHLTEKGYLTYCYTGFYNENVQLSDWSKLLGQYCGFSLSPPIISSQAKSLASWCYSFPATALRKEHLSLFGFLYLKSMVSITLVYDFDVALNGLLVLHLPSDM